MRTALISRHQINISTITSSNQLTQHYNHIMLNSTYSALSSCPSEHQCITIISNSETTPAGTKHFHVTCVCVCMCRAFWVTVIFKLCAYVCVCMCRAFWGDRHFQVMCVCQSAHPALQSYHDEEHLLIAQLMSKRASMHHKNI